MDQQPCPNTSRFTGKLKRRDLDFPLTGLRY